MENIDEMKYEETLRQCGHIVKKQLIVWYISEKRHGFMAPQ